MCAGMGGVLPTPPIHTLLINCFPPTLAYIATVKAAPLSLAAPPPDVFF